MFLRLNLNQGIGWLLLLALAMPAFAHQVDVAEDVGGTLHIEPNDIPRAGESSLAWFALTQKGGEVISLAHCDCKLSLYTQPYDPGDAPIEQPALTAVSAEGYEGIPGAQITFPVVGAYELVLTGEPTDDDDFTPFELRFDVTVAAGQPQVAASPSSTESIPTPPLSNDATSYGAAGSNSEIQSSTDLQPAVPLWRKPVVLMSGILAVGVLWGVIKLKKS